MVFPLSYAFFYSINLFSFHFITYWVIIVFHSNISLRGIDFPRPLTSFVFLARRNKKGAFPKTFLYTFDVITFSVILICLCELYSSVMPCSSVFHFLFYLQGIEMLSLGSFNTGAILLVRTLN